MGERVSLERIIELGWIDVPILHPGGLDLTFELARMCGIDRGTQVLDVAAGNGTSARAFSSRLRAGTVALDISAAMVERAASRHRQDGWLRPVRADASSLPFGPRTFDVVVTECTLCLLDKEKVLAEMVRVTKPGGHVGMHDLCWRAGAPARIRRKLERLEGMKPETVEGWRRLFAAGGLEAIEVSERPALVRDWVTGIERGLSAGAWLRTAARVLGRWGPQALLDLLTASRLLRGRHLGYLLVAARKPL